MILTPENYYSKEADREYMSVSQYKKFLACETAALAELNGEYDPMDREALLVGNYVHAWSEGTLDEFVCNHPEIISSKGATRGELKAPFKVAERMIATLQADAKVMKLLQGDKEVPVIGNIGGVPWKCKIDVRNNQYGYMVDLKTAANITEFKYEPSWGKRVSFIEQWNYMLQAAVYSELDRQNIGATDYRDFYIVAVTKQDPPDHEVFDLTDEARIKEELQKIEMNLPHILQVKKGEIEPVRCGVCAHCRATKKVSKPIFYADLREA